MNIFRRWRRVILSVAGACTGKAQARAPGGAATVVLTQYHVKTSCRQKFATVLSDHVHNSLKATGNIMAEACYEQGDSSVMWMIERWSSYDLYKHFRKSDAARVLVALTKVGLLSPIETVFVKDLELFSKEPPAATGPPLAIMLFVNLRKGAEKEFRLINHAVMSAFRNEPGMLFFELGQVSEHKRRFVVFKKFSNREAFRYHLKSPAIEPVIKFLQTSVKKSPFEREYHRLVQFAPSHKEHGRSDS